MFLSELVRIMEKYPWCSGIDIDLEKGDDYSTHEASTAMFKNIYNTVKGYHTGTLAEADSVDVFGVYPAAHVKNVII